LLVLPLGLYLQRVFVAACAELEASAALTYDLPDLIFRGTLEVRMRAFLLARVTPMSLTAVVSVF
jgi:hypothetical protein